MTAGRLAARGVAALVAAAALLPWPARAQAALGATWLGNWSAVQGNQPGALPPPLVIRTVAGASRLEAGPANCALRYDGTVSRDELDQRLQALRDWQLDAAHWPQGTDTTQLVGLRREFDEALRLVARIAPDTYRRVRAQGAGCDAPGERLYLLSGARYLYDLRFPADSVGLGVTVYERGR